MVKLGKVISLNDLAARKKRPVMDYSAYFFMIEQIIKDSGCGGMADLDEGDNARTERRRLSLAAKQLGYNLAWRKSEPKTLKFVIWKDGEKRPGGRRKKLTGIPERA
jgi:hypothetical protein